MNDPFLCEPLRKNKDNLNLIQHFTIYREKGYSQFSNKIVGLESYLKRCAWDDDENNLVRIYLIKTRDGKDIVAYFGLRSGMIAANMTDDIKIEQQRQIFEEEGIKLFPEVLPGIEISHFAVNDNYRKKLSNGSTLIKGIGKYLFPKYIYPIIWDVGDKSEYIWYIYMLPAMIL